MSAAVADRPADRGPGDGARPSASWCSASRTWASATSTPVTMPTLDRLVDEGAMAAASVRTYGSRPTSVEAYSTMSAGTRVRGVATAALAFPADTPVEDSTAADVIERRLGAATDGGDRPARRTASHRGGRHRRVERAGRPRHRAGRRRPHDGRGGQRRPDLPGRAPGHRPAGRDRRDARRQLGGHRGGGCGSPRPRTRPLPTACAPTPAAFLAEAEAADRVGRPGDPRSRRHRSGLGLRDLRRPCPGRGAAPGRAACHRRHPAATWSTGLPPAPCCS